MKLELDTAEPEGRAALFAYAHVKGDKELYKALEAEGSWFSGFLHAGVLTHSEDEERPTLDHAVEGLVNQAVFLGMPGDYIDVLRELLWLALSARERKYKDNAPLFWVMRDDYLAKSTTKETDERKATHE